MGHRGRVLDQGLDPAKRDRESWDLHLFHQEATGFEPTVDPEAEDSSGSVHLLLGQLALRVIRGSRIPHPLHCGMAMKSL